jgi:hypothetical protein
MTIEQFDKLHKARPFRPFYVHLADGRSYKVEHPEFAGRTKGGRTILISDTDEDAFDVIDLLLVTAIGYTKPRSPARRKAS